MSRRGWIVLAVVLVIAGIGVGVWRFAGSGGPALADDNVSDTATVRRGDLVVTIDGVGAVSPAEQASLAFLSGGEVAEVLVGEGETVEAGQPLIRLDTSDLTVAACSF